MDFSESKIPRPQRDTGKTKGAKTTNSSPRWKKSERSNAQWLVKHDGPELSALYKAVQSRLKDGSVSGRVGHNTGLQFDCVSATYVGENKERELPKWLLEAWIQIIQIAARHNKAPVLFLDLTADQSDMVLEGKKSKVPTLHCITPKRHAQLLEYEQIVRKAMELDESSPSTTDG